MLEAYSVSHGKASAYLPMIELLKTYFQIQLQDDERTRRQKVIGKVLDAGPQPGRHAALSLCLARSRRTTVPLQQMDPQIRRRRTFEALKKLFLRESLKQPLMLIFEDLHWIDSETQGFLDMLSESVASARNFTVDQLSARVSAMSGGQDLLHSTALGAIRPSRGRRISYGLVGSDEVGATGRSPLHALKQLILEKTQGTPFFMEEIVQELVEQGVVVRGPAGVETRRSASLPRELHLPPTVQSVLAARIDRLTPEEKALLQQLAVIGREFPLSLVKHVIAQSEDELYRLLASLQRKEFLYEQPAFPEVEYLFKHALTQEVAYGTVLQERRKVLHEQTGQAMEVLYRESLDEHYSELAHHYSRSGNTQKAVEYLGLAGQQAVQHSANTEAITHLTTALALLQTLPDIPARTQQELRLQIALGVPLMATKGYAASEVGTIYTRARELCQQMGETPQLFPVLLGLRTFYHVRGEFLTARELGEQLLTLAQDAQDPGSLLNAHRSLGSSMFHLGELAPARIQFEQGIALYDAQRHRSHVSLYGIDPGVFGLSYAAWVLWSLGYPDQALQRSQEALTLAQELSHPHNLAPALVFVPGFISTAGSGVWPKSEQR